MHLVTRSQLVIVLAIGIGTLFPPAPGSHADNVAAGGDELLKGLRSVDATTRIAAARSIAGLTEIPTNAIPVLVDALDDMYFDVRTDASKALAKMGHQAVMSLMPALASDDYYTALFAARAVAGMDQTVANPELARQLIRNARIPGVDQERQQYAARALERIQCHDPSLMHELKSAYESTQNDIVQRGLAMSMAYLGDEANVLIPTLVANFVDRPHAQPVLKQIGKAAVPAMIDRLKTATDSRLVWNLYETIADLGADGAPVIPFLVKELQQPRDQWFGELAARLLGQIGVFDKSVLDALEAARHSNVKAIAAAAEASLAKHKTR